MDPGDVDILSWKKLAKGQVVGTYGKNFACGEGDRNVMSWGIIVQKQGMGTSHHEYTKHWQLTNKLIDAVFPHSVSYLEKWYIICSKKAADYHLDTV